MPTRTIAYLRVSTEKQADKGVSLDAQRAKVQAYAELYDLELLEVVVVVVLRDAASSVPPDVERVLSARSWRATARASSSCGCGSNLAPSAATRRHRAHSKVKLARRAEG